VLALTLYYKTHVLLLAAWQSAEQVGIHGAAYRFVDMVQALTIVAAAAVYPRLSRSAPAAGTRSGETWAAGRVAELLLLATTPAAVCLALAREPVIAFLFGSGYGASAPVLGILALALVPLTFDIFAGYALGAAARMRAVAIAYGCALALNVAFNALLIPARGAAGAALAMVLSESALACTLAVVLYRATNARVRRRTGITVLLTGVLGAALATAPLGTPARIGLFLAGAGALYAAAGVLPAGERAVLARALRGRARP
jgi:O-antigen/teichoic acid export membrane protein